MKLWNSEYSAVRNNSLGAEEMAQCLLLFQRVQVQLLAPKSSGALMPVAPAPGNLRPSCGVCTYVAYPHRYTYQIKIIIIN